MTVIFNIKFVWLIPPECLTSQIIFFLLHMYLNKNLYQAVFKKVMCLCVCYILVVLGNFLLGESDILEWSFSIILLSFSCEYILSKKESYIPTCIYWLFSFLWQIFPSSSLQAVCDLYMALGGIWFALPIAFMCICSDPERVPR